jgi:hypothetical protein
MNRICVITLTGLVVAAGLALTGCGKKAPKVQPPAPASAEAAAQAPTSPAASAINPADSVAVQEKRRVEQAVAMRDGKAPPPPEIQLRGGELATPEVLAAWNQKLAQLIFQRREPPESLEEIARKWPMPRLPTPPPGKRIVYDGRYRIIKLDPP